MVHTVAFIFETKSRESPPLELTSGSLVVDFDAPKRESRKKYPPARTTPARITIYSERADILIKVVGGRNEKRRPKIVLKVEGCLCWERKYYRVDPGLLLVLFLLSARF